MAGADELVGVENEDARAYLFAERRVQREEAAENARAHFNISGQTIGGSTSVPQVSSRKPSGLGGLFGTSPSSSPSKAPAPPTSAFNDLKVTDSASPARRNSTNSSTPERRPSATGSTSSSVTDSPTRRKSSSTLPSHDLMPVEGVAPESSSWSDRYRRKSQTLQQLSADESIYREVKAGRFVFRLTPGCNVYGVVTKTLEEEGERDERRVVMFMERIQKTLHRDAKSETIEVYTYCCANA